MVRFILVVTSIPEYKKVIIIFITITPARISKWIYLLEH